MHAKVLHFLREAGGHDRYVHLSSSSLRDVKQELKQVKDALRRKKKSVCKLPEYAKWCTVSDYGVGPYEMAVYGTGDIVSNSICAQGWWDTTADPYGPVGDVLDIGGNIGFITLMLAKAGWNVTTFEPMQNNLDLIAASLCANPDVKGRITVHPFGLGAEPQHCDIWSGANNKGDGIVNCGDPEKSEHFAQYKNALGNPTMTKLQSFEIKRLDDILAAYHVMKVDAVKIDVEGFECQVLKGAPALLSKYKPRYMKIETWSAMVGCDPMEFLTMFQDAGYTVHKDAACQDDNGMVRPTGIEERFMCYASR